MAPMTGINIIRYIQPLFPTSCNLLIETDSPGINVINGYMMDNNVNPNIPSRNPAIAANKTLNR